MAVNIVMDTNAYSAFFKGNEQVKAHLERSDRIYIPSIVSGELFAGFNQGNRREINYAEFTHFMNFPGITIKAIDHNEAVIYGHLIQQLKKNGTPIPSNDLWIATVALSLGLPLLTRDTHFEVITGLQTIGF
jgi:tRNA(fMet)-specific endonuclease VapC